MSLEKYRSRTTGSSILGLPIVHAAQALFIFQATIDYHRFNGGSSSGAGKLAARDVPEPGCLKLCPNSASGLVLVHRCRSLRDQWGIGLRTAIGGTSCGQDRAWQDQCHPTHGFAKLSDIDRWMKNYGLKSRWHVASFTLFSRVQGPSDDSARDRSRCAHSN